MSSGTDLGRPLDLGGLGEERPFARASSRTWLVVLLVAVVTAYAAELVAVLVTTGGHFIYSLDDPYIHLALAREISHGHYGLNPDSASSPSSSALWPFLLAPTARLPFAGMVPLGLNLGFTCGSAWVLHTSFVRWARPWVAAVLAGSSVYCLNLIGVAFTGMEHSLQVVLVLTISWGVIRAVDDGLVSWWLPAAMIVAPLVRYEDAAVSLAASGVLLTLGRRRAALGPLAAWAAALAAFSGFLLLLGLDPLPSSVLAKTHYPPGTSLAMDAAGRIHFAFTQHTFVLCLVVVLGDALVRRHWSALHTYVVVILGAHAVLGDFGWFGRYELYALAACLLALARLVSQWRLPHVVPLRVALGAAAVAACWPLVSDTMLTPVAARDIWSQQAQTGRFVAAYWRAPVAVNDLGQVSWQGGEPVLDLWGLADQQTRVARLDGTPHWVRTSVDRSGARLVVVYPGWFDHEISPAWRRVGTLVGAPTVTSDSREVAFYVVGAADYGRACRDLTAFAATVPATTRVFVTCASASGSAP